ncbi:MAG: M23 family metallopeptidase [Patescibacteria group bacterium]
MKGKRQANLKGLCKNPLFCFALLSFVLLGIISFGSDSFADLNSLKNSEVVFFNSFFNNNSEKDNLFIGQNKALALETPDFKIIEGSFVFGVSTPNILTTKVLGDIFGSSQQTNDIIEYAIAPGDTIQSIAQNFNISVATLLSANNLTSGTKIKVGQTLVILPVSGVIHVVKSGDTISSIAKTYKAKVGEIVSFNSLTGEGDIYIGDFLIVPGGVMPQKAPAGPAQVPLADNFFIFPTEGKITQGLHWYNAVDTANKCGTPIYAAAAGQVQRVKYGWNFGGGNSVTILHSNGVVTYYGHLLTILVKPGDRVDVGDRIALMGGQPGAPGAGISTGCHMHFEVIGAKNPLAKYPIGAKIKY